MGEMVKDPNCAYCVEGELLAKFGIKICELENSKVYLFKEQSHPGRVVVAVCIQRAEQERKSDLSSQETCQRTDRTD